MPYDADARAHLAHLLYSKLIAGEHHLPEVARRSGSLSAELLYKLCRGEREPLLRHLPGLYRGTEDLELVSGLIGAPDLGLVLTEAAKGGTTSNDSRHGALELGAVVGLLQRCVVEAEADGLVTEAELAEAERQLDEIERKAESLRAVLRSRRMRVVRSSSE
jgi:hypothetical protein